VLLCELPDDNPHRYYTVRYLAAETAKGGFAREYWVPRQALTAVLDYIDGERASAVRRARKTGRYEKMLRAPDTSVLVEVRASRRVTLRAGTGDERQASLDSLTPAVRRKLLVEGPDGVEPAAVWLNEDGLARDPHGWNHTFVTANVRLERLGLRGFAGTPHMLRHSFALRWYSVGRLLYERNFAHLSDDEMSDFRAQFGNAWDLVQMLLGAIAVALAFAAALVYLPVMHALFGTASLSPGQLAIVAPFPFIVWAADEIRRALVRRSARRSGAAGGVGELLLLQGEGPRRRGSGTSPT
jgi:hypothetical protein